MAFELPRLPPLGLSEDELQVYWQLLVEKVEEQVTSLTAAIADIAAAQADATAAAADATAAARELARINSYPNPTDVLSAADVGASVTVTMAAHTRVYPVQGSIDVPDKALNLRTKTGLSFSTKYWIYYDDTTLNDATPTLQATTSVDEAQVGAAAGRHVVGVITTPADGGGSTSGGGYLPPGGSGDGTALP